MAIVSGPRVCLYGGSPTSSLAQALARSKNTNKQDVDEEEEEEEPDSLFGSEDKSVKPDRTIALGGQPAHHVAYHRDGRLLVVGCDHGLVKICDSQSRATLRTFSTGGIHDGFAIRTVGWVPEATKGQKMIWSAGDDAILRLWDFSGDVAGVGDGVKPIVMMKGHGDAVRCAVALKVGEKGNQKISLVTGSYDHSIRLWDCEGITDGDKDRGNRCLSIMNHGAPVEALLALHPTATTTFKTPIIISAGGTQLKVWNPETGTLLNTIQTKHSKTITSLCITSIIRGDKDDIENDDEDKKIICWRLITAGLDGLIRIHSADDLFVPETKTESKSKIEMSFPYLHGVKTSLPITALAISPDSTRLVVGTSTGFVTVRQRAKYVPQGVKRKSSYQPKAGTYSFFMRGASAGPDVDDHVVLLQKKKKLRKYDSMLQKFRYGDALDEALTSRDSRAVR